MKKFSLLIALAMAVSTLAFSTTTVRAQADAKAEFERNWYDICYTKKDNEKCYQLSKELLEKYPDSTYAKNATANVKNYELAKSWEKFNASLKAYYTPPQDAAKLETLFSAGEDYLRLQPGQQWVIAQLALAGSTGVLGQVYKNMDKVKGYADRALEMFSSQTPPKDWKPEDWNPLREAVMAKMNQFMGYYLIETKGDPMQAIDYLTKATAVRARDGSGWKDPNNYWLRANIHSKKYGELRAQYDALSDDDKTGDPGKALLTQVNEVIDRMIPDYARVIAAASQPEAKPLSDAARELLESFWKFRVDDPEKVKLAEYINSFKTDPSVAGPAIPVKPETTDTPAPDAPTNGTKLATGQPTAAPTGQSTGSSSGKTAPAKGKARSTRRKPGRRG
ncbi:MAG: hypothetical protein IPM66_19995 [Acidobacteriota bacterium]|nr:MAG: hypothetical protein IPM66_19995 [Acidobacteriota bacterium]